MDRNLPSIRGAIIGKLLSLGTFSLSPFVGPQDFLTFSICHACQAKCLGSRYLKCRLVTGSMDTTWDLARNSDSHAPDVLNPNLPIYLRQ